MKNQYEVRGSTTAIFINSHKYGPMETLIDTVDIGAVDALPNLWYVVYSRKTDSFYAYGNMTISTGVRRIFGIHTLIMQTPKGLMVDHKNHDTLDNRKCNLRIVTNAENGQNKRGAQPNSSSGVRGVYWHKGRKKWCAQVRVGGKKIDVGYFDDLNEAEKVIIQVRKELMPFTVEGGI